MKKGEEASKKLHADAKVQTEEQTTAAIEKLKNKFDSTKAQVLDIVSNFGKIHSDLQELKAEYLADQGELNNYLQLSSTGSMMNSAMLKEKEQKVTDMQQKIGEKKTQIMQMMNNFKSMNNDLEVVKHNFKEKQQQTKIELALLKDQSAPIAQLNHLFAQSNEI